MKLPWPLYLAWKQLFPSQRKISFFSLLAIVGVALGVNVMIVVIAFMQGFQEKFKSDIIDAQGHARMIPVNPQGRSMDVLSSLDEQDDIIGISSYVQGQLLLQNRDYNSIPLAIGLEPDSCSEVLPLNEFLKQGHSVMDSHDAVDLTPSPTTQALEDEVVFISLEVANRLGVRPAAILQLIDENKTGLMDGEDGKIEVRRLDPFISSGEWILEILGSNRIMIREEISNFETVRKIGDGVIDLGYGNPVFEIKKGSKPFLPGMIFRYQCFRSSTIEVYSPSMIEKAKSDEMSPPYEVRVGGIIEVPWQGFHSEVILGTARFMQVMKNQPGSVDGHYLKFSDEVARDEEKLATICKQLEGIWSDNWVVIPWFVENAWFFELLQFEEYLMILIMIPIGLVAAFAIAIALMTSVLRKIREIGLLVAMGAGQVSVGFIFCLQGLIIGTLGAFLGCGLAIVFIHYRDQLMSFIVEKIAGEDGQVGVSQFYDFYSLKVDYPWESHASLINFLSFATFAILVSTVAGLLPAWRAARLNPADALRSE